VYSACNRNEFEKPKSNISGELIAAGAEGVTTLQLSEPIV
jgi:hypothetical protein